MLSTTDLQHCVNVLRKGGLIVAPSDTVYGLVCDATNEDAVKKLISVKNRPWGKPISVFTDGFAMLDGLVECGQNEPLLRTLLPGPFTVILPSRHKVCQLLESERKTLGVRLPRYPFITDLVHAFGGPLTATSANISGRPPHYEASGFMKELSEEKRRQIDFVADAGKLPRNKPSTIIDLTGSAVRTIRKGDILPEALDTFVSHTAEETKKIAAFLTQKYAYENADLPAVFILEGEMGVGKTVFAQGMGQELGVGNIVSPTYVIYYEYPVTGRKSLRTFLHADLYNIEETEEFSHLGLEGYLRKGTVICMEWGNRIGPLFDLIRSSSAVYLVEMKYRGQSERLIAIKRAK